MKKRIGIPKKRVTCGFKWEKPSQSWLKHRRVSGTARSRGICEAISTRVLSPPISLHLSALLFSLLASSSSRFFLEMALALEAPGFYLHSLESNGEWTDLSFGWFSKVLRLAQFLSAFSHPEPITAARSPAQLWLTRPESCAFVQGRN